MAKGKQSARGKGTAKKPKDTNREEDLLHLHVRVDGSIVERLSTAIIRERVKRKPGEERIDKGRVVEMALIDWLEKRGY